MCNWIQEFRTTTRLLQLTIRPTGIWDIVVRQNSGIVTIPPSGQPYRDIKDPASNYIRYIPMSRW
ncbi:MAG: hypothetical protein ABSD42_13060 [Candidatus Bathyarchaeia archaeon]